MQVFQVLFFSPHFFFFLLFSFLSPFFFFSGSLFLSFSSSLKVMDTNFRKKLAKNVMFLPPSLFPLSLIFLRFVLCNLWLKERKPFFDLLKVYFLREKEEIKGEKERGKTNYESRTSGASFSSTMHFFLFSLSPLPFFTFSFYVTHC